MAQQVWSHIRFIWVSLSVLLLLMMMSAAQAEDISLVKADIGYGEYLSGECVTCHKKNGSAEGIPSITGWDAEVFATVLYAYKRKELENPVMRMVAKRLDDEQIASLAVYFASLPEQE